MKLLYRDALEQWYGPSTSGNWATHPYEKFGVDDNGTLWLFHSLDSRGETAFTEACLIRYYWGDNGWTLDELYKFDN